MTNHVVMVKCPACGANSGRPCKTINGHQMPAPHTKRILAAEKLPDRVTDDSIANAKLIKLRRA